MKILLGILPFGAMLAGTIGIYNAQRWGAWLSAATLGLLSAWLPFGYELLISKGGHLGPLLVIFAGLAVANIVAAVCLVRLGYCGYALTGDEKSKSSS